MNFKNTSNFLYESLAGRVNERILEKNKAVTTENHVRARKRTRWIKENRQRYEEYRDSTLANQIPYAGEKKLTNHSIYPENYRVIKNIRENRRTAKNPNGLTPKVAETLKNKLGFKSTGELFWGTENERRDRKFLFGLFQGLILDVLGEEGYSEFIENILIGYIPYARSRAYWMLQETESSFISEFSIDQEYIELGPLNHSVAIYRLFSLLYADFQSSFEKYINTEKHYRTRDSKSGKNIFIKRCPDFNNLDQILTDFYDEFLDKLLKSQSANLSDFGLRVFSIITKDFRDWWDLEEQSLGRSPESYGYYLTADESLDEDVYSSLFEASSEYADKLEKIQNSLEGDYEIEFLNLYGASKQP